LYHTDLWPEFKQLLSPLKKYIKLYIALSNECDNTNIINDLDNFNYSISFHDNYGVDIAPFLYQLEQIKEPIFIKLHSKKSSWGFKFHINWRQLLLNDLIGSVKIFKSNINTLLSDDKVAVLCNPTILMNNREFLNSAKIKDICDILDMDYNIVKNSRFVAGNMFAGKTDFYKRIFTHHIPNIQQLLYNEKGKVSDNAHGTYSHSMERIFGYVVEYNNMKFCYPKYKITKILNSNAPNKKYFSLVKMYNNYCYILEDPNVYGLLEQKSNSGCTITWYHLDTSNKIPYNIINKNTIRKEV